MVLVVTDRVLYVLHNQLPILSEFSPPSLQIFLSTFSWLSPIFDTLPFSLITTAHPYFLPVSNYNHPYFYELKIKAFTNETNRTSLTSNHAVFDPTHPVSEPNCTPSDGLFDGWFGIPFPNTFTLTHVSDSHPTEILALYRLDILLPLYSTILSSTHI